MDERSIDRRGCRLDLRHIDLGSAAIRKIRGWNLAALVRHPFLHPLIYDFMTLRTLIALEIAAITVAAIATEWVIRIVLLG